MSVKEPFWLVNVCITTKHVILQFSFDNPEPTIKLNLHLISSTFSLSDTNRALLPPARTARGGAYRRPEAPPSWFFVSRWLPLHLPALLRYARRPGLGFDLGEALRCRGVSSLVFSQLFLGPRRGGRAVVCGCSRLFGARVEIDVLAKISPGVLSPHSGSLVVHYFRCKVSLRLGRGYLSTTWSFWRHLGAFGAQKGVFRVVIGRARHGATSPERHHQVALTSLLERRYQSDREKSLAVSSLGDARTSPERPPGATPRSRSHLTPLSERPPKATPRGRSRLYGETTRSEAWSDLSERPTEVAPEGRSDLPERHAEVAPRLLSARFLFYLRAFWSFHYAPKVCAGGSHYHSGEFVGLSTQGLVLELSGLLAVAISSASSPLNFLFTVPSPSSRFLQHQFQPSVLGDYGRVVVVLESFTATS
ncbi:hypothetical protein IGI04_025882 [Brassica rapa subsp. trilocularis]|uniref:Uncharacterized protein n=1 Tax=Brassica rapa subsp. trilocularis TaxID=1813537 RepID=A0ABQ7KX44_BRACM|nr:hypothetical protein IGI04_025882 [Brassica rapa subsp. trilocularis]